LTLEPTNWFAVQFYVRQNYVAIKYQTVLNHDIADFCISGHGAPTLAESMFIMTNSLGAKPQVEILLWRRSHRRQNSLSLR
jgi:hypothetical protein